MSAYDYVARTDLTRDAPDGTRVLDWSPGKAAATIQVSHSGDPFFGGWRPPRAAADLLLFGAAAYCVDKTALRADSNDNWTRRIRLEVPVGEVQTWDREAWSDALSFLTGDHWKVGAVPCPVDPFDCADGTPPDVTPFGDIGAVCLFSGGLDSLVGAIDLLEGDPSLRLCLFSHNEGGQAAATQESLYRKLDERYPGRTVHKRLYLRPAPLAKGQARPLPVRRESTTRARSVLFLTAALALAASVGSAVPVFIPENGFIGINVPLTRARVGSNSTRTTHPHFISSVVNAATAAGVSNPVLNPFRLKTKGEILSDCLNPELLAALAPKTISCSHPEASRWVRKPQGNCGYCFPCLIRRAAMSHVGWDRSSDYNWDALTGEGLLDRQTKRASDLRAVLVGAFDDRPDLDLLRNGPIPNAQQQAFLGVWRRGLEELRQWLGHATGLTGVIVGGLR